MSTQLLTNSLLVAGAAVAGSAATLMGTYFFFPGVILDGFTYYLKSLGGFKSQYVDVKAPNSDVVQDDPKFRWHYLDSDPENSQKKPVLLLVHGFGSASDSWCRLASHAVKEFRVISPDLTGHGETRPLDKSTSYDIPVQIERLIHFVNAVIGESEPFHVLGISMGGWLTAELAIQTSRAAKEAGEPHRLRSAIMMCPAGINPPEATDEHREAFHAARVKLLPRTVDDITKMFKVVTRKPRALPRGILSAYMKRRQHHFDIFDNLMDAMVSDNNPALLTPERLSTISCPSMVLWGEDDQLLNPLSLEFFERDIPNVETHMVSECGHVMLIDQLEQVKDLTLEFLRRHL